MISLEALAEAFILECYPHLLRQKLRAVLGRARFVARFDWQRHTGGRTLEHVEPCGMGRTILAAPLLLTAGVSFPAKVDSAVVVPRNPEPSHDAWVVCCLRKSSQVSYVRLVI